MASQEDDLTDWSGTPYHNVELNLEKTGPGTWGLAGHNDMKSATTWTVSDGKLFLVHGYGSPYSSSAKIDLSHEVTAKFTLDNTSVLVVEPGLSPHIIKGLDITLGADTTSEVQGFQYGPVLPLGHHVLLTLDEQDGVLDNQQAVKNPIQAESGTVKVGAYNYGFQQFKWENGPTGDKSKWHDLVFDIVSRELDPERGGVDAMTGPGQITVQMYNQVFDALDQRSKNLFGSCRDDQKRYADRNNLWGSVSYGDVTRLSREYDHGFHLSTTTVAFGWDHRKTRHTFYGISGSVGQPYYSAGKTSLKADDFTVSLYGGTKTRRNNELTGHVGYGFANFKQVRGVEDERFASRFDGHSFFAGVGLSRLYSLRHPNFCLRPGINYDFFRLMAGGFHENGNGNRPYAFDIEDNLYGLRLDDHSLNVHRLKVGLDFQWQPRRWFQATTEVYYLGMYSDNPASADAYFVNDQVNHFTSVANPIAANNLGLGMQLRLPFDNGWELSTGYTTLLGGTTTSQQTSLNAVWKFW